MTFAVDQIRAAFWRCFKGRGEVFFRYACDCTGEEDEEASVAEEWSEFVEELERQQSKQVAEPQHIQPAAVRLSESDLAELRTLDALRRLTARTAADADTLCRSRLSEILRARGVAADDPRTWQVQFELGLAVASAVPADGQK